MSFAEEKDDGLVLVTGATGFVALHLIQLLQREGYKVRGTVRSLKNESKLKPLRNLCPDAIYPLELAEADLTKDEGWYEAVKGCKYCMHVASPFPNVPARKPDDILVPAIEGTKRVLQACVNVGTVKRIVLTSSIVAVHGENKNQEGRIYTEEDWSDQFSDDTDTYTKSKIMAEKVAWDFVASLPPEKRMELSVINPSVVFGPCISGSVCTSLELIHRFFNLFAMPMVPRVCMTICDVRDVALAHLRAMTLPEAVGNRHIIASGHIWASDMGKVLSEEFGRYGYWISTWKAPDFGVYLFSLIDTTSRLVVPRLGHAYTFSNRRMKQVLKIEPREMKDILLDTAHRLVECGAIKKTEFYKPKEKN